MIAAAATEQLGYKVDVAVLIYVNSDVRGAGHMDANSRLMKNTQITIPDEDAELPQLLWCQRRGCKFGHRFQCQGDAHASRAWV